MTDFYQRQKMDEEIRSLRGELDLVKRRLVDLEKVPVNHVRVIFAVCYVQ